MSASRWNRSSDAKRVAGQPIQNYEDILRLCLISRPEGIIVDELAEPYPSFRRTG